MERFKASFGTVAMVIAAGLLVALLAGLEVMASNATPTVRTADPWASHLLAVEQATADGNTTAAVAAWHDAYLAARAARSWEGMLAVGDAYLRLGEVMQFRQASEARARQLYLTALFRARHDRSVEGVVRATEAFARLGDRDVARQGLRIADDLARGGADVERVRELAHRLANRFALAPEDVPTF